MALFSGHISLLLSRSLKPRPHFEGKRGNGKPSDVEREISGFCALKLARATALSRPVKHDVVASWGLDRPARSLWQPTSFGGSLFGLG